MIRLTRIPHRRMAVIVVFLQACGASEPATLAADAEATSPTFDAALDSGPAEVEAPPEMDTVAEDSRVDGAEASTCTPACPLASCGLNNGCEGSCAPCPRDVSCADCPLRLHLVERTQVGGHVKTVRLTLEYFPQSEATRPTRADVRIQVSGPATLLGVEAGPALLQADKSLTPDPSTGQQYQLLDGGIIRTTVVSADNENPIEAGDLLTWTFRLGGAFDPQTEPVTIRLTHDEPLFAPPAADLAVADPAVLTPIALWPDVVP